MFFSPMAIEEPRGNDEEFLDFKKNLKKMLALEREAKDRMEKAERQKLVSVRVEGFEGRSGCVGDVVRSQKRIFENLSEYNNKVGVKDKVKALDKVDGEHSSPHSGCNEGDVGDVKRRAHVEHTFDQDEEAKGKPSSSDTYATEFIVYKDRDGEDSRDRASVDEIKRTLLAELEECRSDDADAVGTFMRSREIPSSPINQKIIYVDTPIKSADGSVCSGNHSFTSCVSCCKISDLSMEDAEGSIKNHTGFETNKSHQAIDTGAKISDPYADIIGSRVVVYQDPEEPRHESWFSRVRRVVISVFCCRS